MKTPIRKKMFWAIYSLILLLTLIVDSLVFFTYKYDIESKISHFGNQTIQESAVNISRQILNQEESLTYIIEECDFFSEDGQRMSYQENSIKMKMLAALLGNSGFDVISCYLQRNDGSEEFWNDGSITVSEFRHADISGFMEEEKKLFQLNRGTVVWRCMKDEPESIYIIKNIIDGDTLEKEGLMCVQISKDFFESLQNGNNLPIILYDEQGEVLYYSEQLIGSIQEILAGNTQDFLEVYADISKKNWFMTGWVSKQQVLNILHHLLVLLGVIEICFFIVSFWVAKYVSDNMTANITALIEGMKQLECGKAPSIVQAKSSDETAYLVETFNNMNMKLQETIELLTVNRTQKERAEYNALIAQLNPHFLYNSLASISAMAKLNHQNEIVAAIEKLAKLLRICLSGDDSEITLATEFEYISQYLSLERLITGEQLDWEIDCDEKFYVYKVPKLILQPLVENCIVHGFVTNLEDAMIVIWVRVEDGKLVIEVADNGIGMSQEYADEILTLEEVKKYEQDRRHIGIKSIQQRIIYLYGSEYGIHIQTQEKAGTSIRLVLPIIKE